MSETMTGRQPTASMIGEGLTRIDSERLSQHPLSQIVMGKKRPVLQHMGFRTGYWLLVF
jgi:hypothetical protein